MTVVGAVIQCRMRSSRLPGKMLREVMPGHTLLDVVVARARAARRLDRVVVATSTEAADDVIADHCRAKGYPLFRGSEDDVLGRMLGACRAHGIDVLVRLTGDNPFIDPRLIDDLVAACRAADGDYACTTMMGHSTRWAEERTFPRGVSMEVVSVPVLAAVEPEVSDPLDRDSVTFYVYDRPERFRLVAFRAEGPYAGWRHPELRLTVDAPEDFELARRVLAEVAGGDPAGFSTGDAIALVAARADLQALNAHVGHNVVSELKALAAGPTASPPTALPIDTTPAPRP